MAVNRRLFLETHADRGIGRRFGRDAVTLQNGQHFIAVGAHGVDAQIKRSGMLHAARQGENFLFRHALDQPFRQPVGEVHPYRQRQVVGGHCLDLFQPFVFILVQQRLQFAQAQALHLRQQGQNQVARRGVRRGEVLQQALAAQHGIHRFGDEGAILGAKFVVAAEIAAQARIGRMGQRQDIDQGVYGVAEAGRGELHGLLVPGLGVRGEG